MNVDYAFRISGRIPSALTAALATSPDARHVRQMVEEFRVSLFAQRVRTAYPVSEQRIWKALDRLTG